MALTYVAIATVTVGSGGAANIEFTSIPATYTDLVVKLSGRSTHSSTDTVQLTFNSNGSNYDYRSLLGDGSAANSYGGDTSTYLPIQFIPGTSQTASTFSNMEVYIPNYAGSTNKSVSTDSVQENNATSAYAGLYAHIWSNTSAITSVKLDPVNGNFAQYSTATLYGIKNTV